MHHLRERKSRGVVKAIPCNRLPPRREDLRDLNLLGAMAQQTAETHPVLVTVPVCRSRILRLLQPLVCDLRKLEDNTEEHANGVPAPFA